MSSRRSNQLSYMPTRAPGASDGIRTTDAARGAKRTGEARQAHQAAKAAKAAKERPVYRQPYAPLAFLRASRPRSKTGSAVGGVSSKPTNGSSTPTVGRRPRS